MGLPALKHDVSAAARRPHLRVVKQQSTTSRQHKAETSHPAAYQAFVFFTAIVGVVALLGVGRVWLSVQAAGASIDCGKLQTQIKAARYEGDMLEIQQSALATPSRIQAIAVGTMGMAPASSVSYLRIESGSTGPVVAVQTSGSGDGSRPVILGKLMGVVAAEARMMLVGDVGLASSK
jgi:cell division protein FtsL